MHKAVEWLPDLWQRMSLKHGAGAHGRRTCLVTHLYVLFSTFHWTNFSQAEHTLGYLNRPRRTPDLKGAPEQVFTPKHTQKLEILKCQ